jgi:hypothetical protein
MRMRSPSTAPPLNGLDGSTAITPTDEPPAPAALDKVTVQDVIAPEASEAAVH